MKRGIIFICIVSIGIAFSPGVSGSNHFQKQIKPRIIITQPNQMTKAKTLTWLKILWKRKGKMHPRVKINLLPVKMLKPSKGIFPRKFYRITADAANFGNYRWRIPKHIRAGKYRVKIFTLDNLTRAQSAIFTIIDLNLKPGTNLPIKPAKDFNQKLVCLKPDLVIERHYTKLDFPASGDSDGTHYFVIKNIKHPQVKFPAGLCFDFIVTIINDPEYNGDKYFSRHVCGADIITLRKTGQVILKFHSPDCIAYPDLLAKVDSLQVINECSETNNTLVIK